MSKSPCKRCSMSMERRRPPWWHAITTSRWLHHIFGVPGQIANGGFDARKNNEVYVCRKNKRKQKEGVQYLLLRENAYQYVTRERGPLE